MRKKQITDENQSYGLGGKRCLSSTVEKRKKKEKNERTRTNCPRGALIQYLI